LSRKRAARSLPVETPWVVRRRVEKRGSSSREPIWSPSNADCALAWGPSCEGSVAETPGSALAGWISNLDPITRSRVKGTWLLVRHWEEMADGIGGAEPFGEDMFLQRLRPTLDGVSDLARFIATADDEPAYSLLDKLASAFVHWRIEKHPWRPGSSPIPVPTLKRWEAAFMTAASALEEITSAPGSLSVPTLLVDALAHVSEHPTRRPARIPDLLRELGQLCNGAAHQKKKRALLAQRQGRRASPASRFIQAADPILTDSRDPILADPEIGRRKRHAMLKEIALIFFGERLSLPEIALIGREARRRKRSKASLRTPRGG